MWSKSFAFGLLAASLATPVLGQLHSDCDPRKQKNCPPDPAFGLEYNFNFNSTPDSKVWKEKVRGITYSPGNGAAFTLNKQGDSPTLETNFYFFWGRTEVHLKAAKGRGIVSSIVWMSDTLDEMDWEWIGGNSTHAESNYFGKGEPDYLNAIWHPVAKGVQDDFHNYTNVWTKDYLQWWLDGQLIRTLLPKDANNSRNYPQTPMKLSLGIWAGGDPTLPKGTREWAGGDTDYKQGPFTMYVQSATVQDFSSGKEYQYTDSSGSWESIKVVAGNSTVKEVILAPPPPPTESVADKWNNLSSGTKIGIYAGGGGLAAVIFGYALWTCIRRRRQGKAEAARAAAADEQQRREDEAFKRSGLDPDQLNNTGSSLYDPHGTAAAAGAGAGAFVAGGAAKKEMYDSNKEMGMYAAPGTPGGHDDLSRASTAHSYNPAYNEKLSWDPTNGGGVGQPLGSPMPLLQQGASSPRIQSPGPRNQGPYSPGMDRMRSPGPMIGGGGAMSPQRSNTGQQQLPRGFPAPAPPSPMDYGQQQRSFSTPNAPMRSPGGGREEYGMQRMHSPAPLPQPNRSFSSSQAPRQGYGGGGGGGGGYIGSAGGDGYWHGNNGGGGQRGHQGGW